MLRERLSESLKDAMRAKNARRVSTLRLIIATLKDRDIAKRSEGDSNGISDDEVLRMLATMIRQRRESIAAYEQGGRIDLAEAEQEEISIIEDFLPTQLTEEEVVAAIREAIAEIGAAGLKDMGRTMAVLKSRYPGRMDFGTASARVKSELAAQAE
ncbi:GatB/YqeY domain-containing protein [Oceanibacterium hippocampi]|nr:GatB/YqeY domain-containing protein [Oceanibacterium hippocampi]